MNQNPSAEEVVEIMGGLDTTQSGRIGFSDFLKALQIQKDKALKGSRDKDLVAAFMAMGGASDRSGRGWAGLAPVLGGIIRVR